MSSEASVDTAQDGSVITESEVQVGEFACRLLTIKKDASWFGISHVLHLPLAYCEKQRKLQNFMLYGDDGTRCSPLSFEVINEAGDTVFTAEDGWFLQYRFDQYRRGLVAAELEVRFAVLQQRLDSLPANQKPGDHPVFTHAHEFNRELRAYRGNWMPERHLYAAQDLLGRIEHEIDRLEKSDPLELAIERLMADDCSSAVQRLNLRTVAAINAASVRTGGFIELFGEEQLSEHYRSVLSGRSDPLACLTNSELLVNIDDYAPNDLLSDPDLEAAPLQVPFESNKGEVLYDVSYGFVNGAPTAVVRLPLRVYQRHAPEYGQQSRFPELPHGIVWAVEIEFDSRIVVQGLVDLELNKKLEKWERGKRRAKHADARTSFDDILLGAGSTVGDMLFGAETSGVPPWYQGKARPGRRK